MYVCGLIQPDAKNVWQTLAAFRSGTQGLDRWRGFGSRGSAKQSGVRATAPIEDICRDKIRGCSCSGGLRQKVRFAPIATKVRSAAKRRDDGPNTNVGLDSPANSHPRPTASTLGARKSFV
jgi:hypothetical protein